MFQEILALVAFVAIGYSFSVEKVDRIEEPCRDHCLETIRILPLLEVIDLERLLNAVELDILGMLHRDFELDRCDPGVSNLM
jgi:hypothetical protein